MVRNAFLALTSAGLLALGSSCRTGGEGGSSLSGESARGTITAPMVGDRAITLPKLSADQNDAGVGKYLSSNASGELTWATPPLGVGDMTLAVYDANGNNACDDADRLGGQLPAYYLNPANLASSVAPGKGGTGLSAGPNADGQLLIGSSTGTYTRSTLSAGSGIAITNGAGSVTIATSSDYLQALTGEVSASAPAGGGSASATLSTSAVTGKILTGLDATQTGTVAATDSILQAFGKVQNKLSSLSGTNSGDLTLAAVGSSPNANGASLSSQQLTLQPANATNPGVVTIGAQTFAGTKTFNNDVSFGDDVSVTGTITGFAQGRMGSVIASATVLPIDAAATDGDFFEVTGTTQIEELPVKPAGTRVLLRFTDASGLTVQHNASKLMLQGSVSFKALGNDMLELISLGSSGGIGVWKEIGRQLGTFTRLKAAHPGASFPNNTTQQVTWTEAVGTDTLNEFAANVFTAAQGGTYFVQVKVMTDSTNWSVNDQVNLYITGGGETVASGRVSPSVYAGSMILESSAYFVLAAGQQISVSMRFTHSPAAGTDTIADPYFSQLVITRVR